MKNRMTLDDVLFDMRSRGMSMTKGILGDLIENGQIPIGSVQRPMASRPPGECS